MKKIQIILTVITFMAVIASGILSMMWFVDRLSSGKPIMLTSSIACIAITVNLLIDHYES